MSEEVKPPLVTELTGIYTGFEEDANWGKPHPRKPGELMKPPFHICLQLPIGVPVKIVHWNTVKGEKPIKPAVLSDANKGKLITVPVVQTEYDNQPQFTHNQRSGKAIVLFEGDMTAARSAMASVPTATPKTEATSPERETYWKDKAKLDELRNTHIVRESAVKSAVEFVSVMNPSGIRAPPKEEDKPKALEDAVGNVIDIAAKFESYILEGKKAKA